MGVCLGLSETTSIVFPFREGGIVHMDGLSNGGDH